MSSAFIAGRRRRHISDTGGFSFFQKYTFEEKYFKITLETIQTLMSLGTGAFGGELGGEKKLAKLREASPNCQPISQFFEHFEETLPEAQRTQKLAP